MGCGASKQETKDDRMQAKPAATGGNARPGPEPVFDKIIVRLENGCVPKKDLTSESDPVVSVSLVDAAAWPETLFGVKLLDDRSDIKPLTEFTFTEKTDCNCPVWFEETMLMAYRDPASPSQPKGKLKVVAMDKDSVGKDDVLLSGFELDPWRLGSKWHRVRIPCDCEGADDKHHITISVRVQLGEDRIVGRDDWSAAKLEHKVITLQKGNLAGGGRAVVSWRTLPENRKALFWLPGLNASFHHLHCLKALLEAGWDFYTLDCRRMGRSKRYAAEFDPKWDPLDAHTTGDFKEYCEEIDAMIDLACSSKTYESKVLYGNSTGALTCSSYLRHGANAGKIDGLALNGPFFDWHLASYQEVLMNSAFLTDAYAKLAVGGEGRNVQDGRGVSCYTIKTWAQYYWDEAEGLRSVAALNTTAEWAKAVTAAQKELRETKTPFLFPIFVISSVSDTWVSSEESLAISDFLGPMRTEVQVFNAEHDVFLSATAEKVSECIGYMVNWLQSHFP